MDQTVKIFFDQELKNHLTLKNFNAIFEFLIKIITE